MYFGPTAPAGQESNWIETVPGRGFYPMFRIYSPTEGLLTARGHCQTSSRPDADRRANEVARSSRHRLPAALPLIVHSNTAVEARAPRSSRQGDAPPGGIDDRGWYTARRFQSRGRDLSQALTDRMVGAGWEES